MRGKFSIEEARWSAPLLYIHAAHSRVTWIRCCSGWPMPDVETPACTPYFPLGRPRLAQMIHLTQIRKQKQRKEAVLLPRALARLAAGKLLERPLA